MTEVHVYGVVSASAKIDIAEDGVRLIVHRDVAALVSDIGHGEMQAVRVLRAHWRVLEQAASTATVIPVRFGTVMADERAVVDDFLEPSHDELARALAEMAGKVQLTVKGFYEEDALMTSVVGARRRSPGCASRCRASQRRPPTTSGSSSASSWLRRWSGLASATPM